MAGRIAAHGPAAGPARAVLQPKDAIAQTHDVPHRLIAEHWRLAAQLSCRPNPGMSFMTHTRPNRRQARWPRHSRRAHGLVLTLALAGCGGGGDGDTPATPPNTAPAALTLRGTAATGAALVNAPVQARCQGGDGTATTLADGSYTVSNLPAGASLPCVLKVTGPAGPMFSLATGSGRSASANITPVTTLVVAHLAGGMPASFFDGWSTSAAASLSAGSAQQAVDAVKSMLAGVGVDLSAIDVLSGTLVAATGGTTGNAHDQALDALNARLGMAGTTLTQLASAVAALNPAPAGGGTPTLSSVASLPPELLLKPRAGNCASLRSGSYRSIDLEDANTQRYAQGGGYPTLLTSIDAVALTVTDQGETTRLTPAGDCRYTIGDGVGAEPDAELIVSGAGVILIRYLTENFNGSWRAAVVIPVQSHTLAALAGDWNILGFDRSRDSDPHVLRTGTASFSASGAISGAIACDGLTTGCASEATTTRITADDSGGFHLQGDGWRDRLHAYRAGGGELMLISQSAEGVVSFFTRKQARTLPAVGDVSQGWQFNIAPSGTATASFTAPAAVNAYKSTVASVDSTQQRYVRQSVIDGTDNVTRPETVVLNSPRDGFARRLAASHVLRSDGATSTVNEWISLPLRGMGFSALGMVNSQQMWWSVTAAQ